MVVPAATRRALTEHAHSAAPNEACGLIVVQDDVAVRYVPGVNAAESPYRFDLRMDDPEVWFLEDDGFELAVFHSHLSSAARPSRTDVRNIGMWEGKPYVIYTVRTDELAAWRITGDAIEPLPLTLG